MIVGIYNKVLQDIVKLVKSLHIKDIVGSLGVVKINIIHMAM